VGLPPRQHALLLLLPPRLGGGGGGGAPAVFPRAPPSAAALAALAEKQAAARAAAAADAALVAQQAAADALKALSAKHAAAAERRAAARRTVGAPPPASAGAPGGASPPASPGARGMQRPRSVDTSHNSIPRSRARTGPPVGAATLAARSAAAASLAGGLRGTQRPRSANTSGNPSLRIRARDDPHDDPNLRLEASLVEDLPPFAADAARLAAHGLRGRQRSRAAQRPARPRASSPDRDNFLGDLSRSNASPAPSSPAPSSPRAPPPPPPFPSPRMLPPDVFNALYVYANYSLAPEQRPGNGVPTRAEAPGLYAQESPPAVGEGPRAPPPAAVRGAHDALPVLDHNTLDGRLRAYAEALPAAGRFALCAACGARTKPGDPVADFSLAQLACYKVPADDPKVVQWLALEPKWRPAVAVHEVPHACFSPPSPPSLFLHPRARAGRVALAAAAEALPPDIREEEEATRKALAAPAKPAAGPA
jgi:hypothetical protein